jgi:toxin ParE1/3/4
MRRVRWSRDALDDLKQIAVFIAEDDLAKAWRIEERIRATGEKLASFATGHPGRVSGTYEKSVSRSPYIMVYEMAVLDGIDSVTVMRIIHSARNWPEEDWPE